jgi:GTP-binding protein
MIRGLVAIVGRPNVGKSTLFNLLTRSKTAIVDDQPGVTRDRIYGEAYFDKDKDAGFMVIDTGGFEFGEFKFQPFTKNEVWQQTTLAIDEADIVLFVVDAKTGLHQHDHELVQLLKRKSKIIIYVVNKVDGEEAKTGLWEFYALGSDKLMPISAAHNRGVKDLLEEIQSNIDSLDRITKKDTSSGAAKIALIGRPNAGKSSILNRLCGEERAVVSDIPGTTRDSIDTLIKYNGDPYLIIDTAGIRRRTKIYERLEVFSVMRSLRVIDNADIVVVVIDAVEGITDQDARLINLALDRFHPVLIAVNKWDLIPNKTANSARDYAKNIRETVLKDSRFLPVIFISCLENQRVHKLLGEVARLRDMYRKRVATAPLNAALAKIVHDHTPQLSKKLSKRVKFYYATQVRIEPPTIVVKCNIHEEIQESYKRYMTHKFRELLGFEDIPIRILFRGKSEEKKEHYESQSYVEDQSRGVSLG